jgi:hypothetical protein
MSKAALHVRNGKVKSKHQKARQGVDLGGLNCQKLDG